MRNNEWDDIGMKIRDTVQNAIDSQDFKQLNKTLNNAINSAMSGVRSGFQNSSGRYQHPYAEDGRVGRPPGNSMPYGKQIPSYSPARSQTLTYRKSPNYNTAIFAKRPAGVVAGPLLTSLGFSFMGLFGILGITFFLTAIFSPVATAAFFTTATIMSLLGIGGLGTGIKGIGHLKRVKRFRRYVEIMGERGYCEISEFVSKTGKSSSYIRKDLKIMIERGMFLHGHLDDQQTSLIVTQEAYHQYQEAKALQQRKKEEEKLLEAKPKENAIPEECQKILVEGKAYIRHIHACNEALPGEEISNKLSRLEEIMEKIFTQVEHNPGIAPELHKFMSYYLPTTSKLIDAYRELENQPVAGENITNTKREIEDTLDTINTAFEKLLDRFFQDTAWDISSDISVMKTMLAQEGLTGGDFPQS